MSIKIVSPNIVYLGAAEAPSGAKKPITVNLNYIQDTTPSNPQEKEVWYNTSDNKIYTYKDGQWTETGEATVGVWYYDTVNDKYYLWDGTSLEETELNIYEKIENKTDNFESTSSITYPSSKALSDGLQDTLNKSYKPNLFDLKINSEPTAQKGWSCISYPTQNKLNKTDVPTAYEFLKDKLDTIDKASTGWQNSTSGYTGDIFYNSLDNYYYFYSGSAICKSRYIDLSDPITIASTSVGAFSMCVINNHTYFFTNGSGWDESTKIYDENGTLLKNFNIKRPALPRIVIGNKAYTSIIGNYISIQYNKRYLALPYFDFSNTNDIQFNENCIEEMDNQQIGNSVNLGNKFFASDAGSLFEIDIDTLQWTSYPINSGIAPNNPFVTGIFNDSKLIVMYNGGAQYPSGYHTRIYQFDINNKNFTSLYSYSNTSWVPSPIFDSGQFSRNCGIQRLGEYYFVVANNNSANKSSKIYQTTDFINFTEFYATTPTETFGYTIDNLLVSPKNEFAIHISHSYTGDNQYLYTVYISVVYTDTINGIDIKYYKNGDWKICTPDIAVGNDANLQSVYEYLGYLNYWWIDENNEQITLQRNSNMWTMMYVDDDYEDSSLPSGNYLPYALKPLKYSNIVASTWVADNTYADYGYKCDITCNGVTSNSIAQVIFALTEADSGNYATVCQTSTNTVTIYSKVDTTITIPTILIQGV